MAMAALQRGTWGQLSREPWHGQQPPEEPGLKRAPQSHSTDRFCRWPLETQCRRRTARVFGTVSNRPSGKSKR